VDRILSLQENLILDLENVWKLREEQIYPQLFGPMARGIFPLTQQTFERFDNAEIDPRWLTHGIFEFEPKADRATWVYITSGYSNPWDIDPDKFNPGNESGAGIEFALETKEAADWPIVILQNMLAFDMMLSTGQLGDKPPIGLHDRIPLRAPIDGQPSSLVRNLVTCEPQNFPGRFQLPSGVVRIMQFVGITDEERDYARNHGMPELVKMMVAAQCYPETVPSRNSAV
jgi:hypothetical protein